MPLNEIDYSKTMFYRLVCKDLEVSDFYIGHTTDFKSRKTNIERTVKILTIQISTHIYIELFVRMVILKTGKWF